MSNNPRRDKVLKATDVQAELEKCGVRIPAGAVPDGKGWLKAHSLYSKDEHPSASINVGDDPNTRGLYHDFVLNLTKSFFDIVAEFGPYPCMTGRDVYFHYGKESGVLNGGTCSLNKKGKAAKPKGQIVTTYDYHDAAGKLIFQVCRMKPKSFRQRRPDGNGGWIWDINGVSLVPYHLPEIIPAALVYVCEGEKDVDRLRAAGLTATCNPMGAGKWRSEYSAHLQGKFVGVLTDNDVAGHYHAQDVARKLHGIAGNVKVVDLPGLPDKGDVSDWLAAGGTPEQLRSLVEATPDWDPTSAPPEEPQKATTVPKEVGHYYVIYKGCHCLVVDTGDSSTECKPLCNFTAQVTDEITLDDGLRVTKEFIITGNSNGRPLASVKVPTKDFDTMKWPRQEWGSEASVTPSRNHLAHLPNAILGHSRNSGINQQTVHAHTGWRQIKGVWRFLHGGGGIGPGEAVAVDLGRNLGNYQLPDPGGLEAAQASLRFLDVGPWEITAPLIACAYLAPFTDLCKIDFSVWFHGVTGSMKSTLAALALCHFGNFTRTTLPGSWFSTVNSLEKLCFTLKDVLTVIDDFMPASNSKESHRMTESAARIIYQAGNRSARGRLSADLSARPNYYPRCLIISTGEMLLPGQRQSATARYLGIELDPKKIQIDKDRLTKAQEEASLYSAAMAAYLEHLAPRLDDTVDEIKDLWTGYRKAFQKGMHLRLPEIQSWLTVGFEMFLRFQTRMGAISGEQAYDLLNRAWKVFQALGEKHAWVIEGEKPTLKFLNVLRELFLQGKIFAKSPAGGQPPRGFGWDSTNQANNAGFVGWVDSETVYLMPETAYRVVHEAIRQQGDFLSLGKNEMLAALAREGFIEPDKKKEQNTQVKWMEGRSQRVICLPVERLRHDEVMENDQE
jgi:hypothetical protein